jgi:hypothetical protein
MVPSSRDMYRKIILKMRNITEFQLFEKVIEIVKAVQFNIFYHGIIDVIKLQDHNIVYPLLLEIIEWEAEHNKRSISTKSLVDRYMSPEFIMEEDDEKEKQSVDEEPDTMEHPSAAKPSSSKKKDDVKEITEHDIDPFFIKEFKEQIRLVYEQEMEKKRLEDEQGDLLIIEL